MCLIAIAQEQHPDYPFILIANRDEFYARPTQKMHYWDQGKSILAGRDLEAGGTWLAISKRGRLAAVTNIRDFSKIKQNAPSRGQLPLNFVKGNDEITDYLMKLKKHSDEYSGYNLLFGSLLGVGHYNNVNNEFNIRTTGMYAVSNASLDTLWPKVIRAKTMLNERMKNDISHDDLLEILADNQLADDEYLPETGLSLELERAMSAICTRTQDYGTCSSTVITIDKENQVKVSEYSYPVGDRVEGLVTFNFKIGA